MTRRPPGAVSAAVGAHILLRRTAGRLTQQDIADAMVKAGHSWNHSTVSKVEHGDRPVTVDELVSLAAHFGVMPSVLLRPPAIE